MRAYHLRAWQGVVAGCAVLAIPSVASPGSALARVSYLTGLALIAINLVMAARSLTPGPERRRWLPWVAGLGCTVTGSAVWQLASTPAMRNVALVLWIAFYIPATVAVIRTIEQRAMPRAQRGAIVKDVTVVTAAAAVFAWYLLIQPALTGLSIADRWAVLAAFCFPLGDVIVLALAVTVLLAPGRPTTAERLIVLGFGITLLVDTTNALLPTVSTVADRWYMPSYLLINAILTAAIRHPSRAAAALPAGHAGAEVGMRGWRLALLGIALSGVGLSAIVVPHDGWGKAPAAAAMCVMIGIILFRLRRAITDLETAQQILRHQATHDQLTGLANRVRLMDELRHAVSRTSAVLFVDLDGFKRINDTLGHHCGDTVLKTVAERLTSTVRGVDTVARIGGDEFVLVCTDTDDVGIAALAARIERTVGEPIATSGGPVTVGVSIGAVTLAAAGIDEHAPDRMITELLHAADSAMYTAKREGGGARIVQHAGVA